MENHESITEKENLSYKEQVERKALQELLNYSRALNRMAETYMFCEDCGIRTGMSKTIIDLCEKIRNVVFDLESR